MPSFVSVVTLRTALAAAACLVACLSGSSGASGSASAISGADGCSFPFPRVGVQVKGINDAKGHAGRASPDACQQACCQTDLCTVWNYHAAPTPHGTYPAATATATSTAASTATVTPATCRIGVGVLTRGVFASAGWVGGATTKAPAPSPAPPPPPPRPPPPPPAPVLHRSLVSNTLGDHMVLQRAPAASVIYGAAAPGALVTSVLDDAPPLTAIADKNGTWRQLLPPTPAGGPHTITVASSDGSAVTMTDVLFGEVYLCGGQSNMAFALSGLTNATAEEAYADHYSGSSGIRLFTVGQATPGTTTPAPLGYLHTIEQNWTKASNATVAAGGTFGVFSAVCFVFGRTIHDGLGGHVPVGLVSSNWPGTTVEEWAPPAAFHACGRTDARGGGLFNGMVAPFAVGPMAVAGFSWYQGESNVQPDNTTTGRNDAADRYACLFPAMIAQWRFAFRVPDAFFGFVQLATWCEGGGGIPAMRGQLIQGSRPEHSRQGASGTRGTKGSRGSRGQAGAGSVSVTSAGGVPGADNRGVVVTGTGQMAAMRLARVGYGTNADHGMGCGIHPRDKQFVAMRLGNAALAIQHGHDRAWRSPSYANATATQSQKRCEIHANATATATATGVQTVTVTVSLVDVGGLGLTTIYPYNYLPIKGNCSSPDLASVQACGWASIKSGGVWHNATVAVGGGGRVLVLTSTMPCHATTANGAGTVTGSAYGWADVPMLSAYDKATGLPVLPWNRSL